MVRSAVGPSVSDDDCPDGTPRRYLCRWQAYPRLDWWYAEWRVRWLLCPEEEPGMNWSKTCGGLLTAVSIGQINWRKNHTVSEGPAVKIHKHCWSLTLWWHKLSELSAELQGSFLRHCKGKGQWGALGVAPVGAFTAVIRHQPARRSSKGYLRVSKTNYEHQRVPHIYSTNMCHGV